MTRAHLAWILLLVACGGGEGSPDAGPPPGSLVGSWAAQSIEIMGMHTSCPGEIQVTEGISVSCATESLTFRSDGTMVFVTTTDETGAPLDWRAEGIWSAHGDVATVTLLREGPDAASMDAMDPPELWIWEWSVSGDTLTVGFTSVYATVTATYQRI